VRAQQSVSEMVVESLARQAQALSERSGQPFEEAFEEVLKTPAGYRLAELSDGPHRHEKAAEWQAELLADRHAQRRAHLRISENGHGTGEEPKSWLVRYMDQVEGTDGRAEYHALLRQRFARPEG
jgi:hypothetical protein